jgi:hypothetical protein
MNASGICLLAVSVVPHIAIAQSLTPEQKVLREVYRELVEINTTDSAGDTTQAARAMAARLKSAGFSDSDMQVIFPRWTEERQSGGAAQGKRRQEADPAAGAHRGAGG